MIRTALYRNDRVLPYAGQAPLYVRRKRDVIIWFGFMKRKSLAEGDGYKFMKYLSE